MKRWLKKIYAKELYDIMMTNHFEWKNPNEKFL